MNQPPNDRHADNIFQWPTQNWPVEPIDLSTIGKRVGFVRELREMSQSELARATKFSQPSISDLENDRTKEVSAKLLGAVSAALSISWEFLLYGDQQSQESSASVAESELISIYRALGAEAKVGLLEFGRHLKSKTAAAQVTAGETQPQTAARGSGIKKQPVDKNRTRTAGNLFDVQTGSKDAVGGPRGVSKPRRKGRSG